jgi:hypothetical protein
MVTMEKNGWQLDKDMPAIVSSAFNELVPAMSGVMDLPAEYKDDPAAFIQAFMLAGGEAFKLFRTE